MHDIETPPGQSSGGTRYLRDVIKKYQEEEYFPPVDLKPQERSLYSQGRVAPTDAEERSAARLRALADLRHLYQHLGNFGNAYDRGLLARSIRTLEENP